MPHAPAAAPGRQSRKAFDFPAPAARIASSDCAPHASPSAAPARLHTLTPSDPVVPSLSTDASCPASNWRDHVPTALLRVRIQLLKQNSARSEMPGTLFLTRQE